jgi:Cyclic nucleotide-binding domain
VLETGREQIYRLSPDGEEITLSVVEAGNIFGEMALTGQQFSEVYARAMAPSVVCSLRRSDLEQIILRHPEVGFTQATDSLSNTNPLLGSAGLQDNGGHIQTIALLPDSPAVDLVGEGACPPPQTDQRCVERPQGEACDSGAFELEQQAEPTTKEECKNGGYEEFGFKNQGQCVAFVERGAKSSH